MSAAPGRAALTTEPIPGLIARLAIPASVGMFCYTMFNVVDTKFAGLISTDAIAALSLSFPIFFIVIAVGSGLSTSTTALVGNAMGSDQDEEARIFALQAISIGLITAVILGILGILASPFLFRYLGASDEYLVLCMDYMTPIFYGAPCFLMVYVFNGALNAVGDTRSHRNFLFLGLLLNLGLDPWFIYGGFGVPAMGVTGIALATVLIQGVGVIYLGRKAVRAGVVEMRSLSDLLPRSRVVGEILAQWLPSSFNYLTIGIGIFVITWFISRFGKEGVAAYGIATRVEQIVLMPTVGLNVAVMSLTAQNRGAGLGDRVRESRRSALLHGFWIMLIGSALVFFLCEPVMALFTDDPQVIAIGAHYLSISAFCLYGYVILFANVATLQGLKRPMFAVWIGIFRQIAAPVAVFWFLTVKNDVGLPGIWWGIFFIVWFSACVTMLYTNRRMNRDLAGLAPPEKTDESICDDEDPSVICPRQADFVRR